MNVSARTLNVLSALTWYVGGFVLLLKGRSLLAEAVALRPEYAWHWLAATAGVLLGALQIYAPFGKACRKNLARIASLEQPKVWQFFRPGFFVALALMIAAGVALSRLAHDRYALLLGVAALDLSIATGLLGSSYIFWTEKTFSKQ